MNPNDPLYIYELEGVLREFLRAYPSLSRMECGKVGYKPYPSFHYSNIPTFQQ
jgi:hypothetical protein